MDLTHGSTLAANKQIHTLKYTVLENFSHDITLTNFYSFSESPLSVTFTTLLDATLIQLEENRFSNAYMYTLFKNYWRG